MGQSRPIIKDQVKDSLKSFKLLYHEKRDEAKYKADALKFLVMNKSPEALEVIKNSLDPILESAANDILNKKLKEETGYTLEELKYKCLEGYRLYNQYKSDLLDHKKNKITKESLLKQIEKESGYTVDDIKKKYQIYTKYKNTLEKLSKDNTYRIYEIIKKNNYSLKDIQDMIDGIPSWYEIELGKIQKKYRNDKKKYKEALKNINKERDSRKELYKEYKKVYQKTEQIEKSSGMTLKELRSESEKGLDLYTKYKDVITNKTDIVTKKLTLDKNALFRWLGKQSDVIYSGFYLMQFKELVDKVQTISAQLQDGGVKLVQESMNEIKSIQDLFSNSKKSEKGDNTNNTNKFTSKKNSLTGEFSYNDVELGDLIKSQKTEIGSSAETIERKMNQTAQQASAILDSLLNILSLLLPLFTNYQINKYNLKVGSDVQLVNTFKENAHNKGFTDNDIIPVKFDKDLNKVIPVNEDDNKKLEEAESVESIPEANIAFCSDKSEIVSGIDRVLINLKKSSKICKLDLSKPLISKSAIISDGRLKNLEFAGYNYDQLVDAIMNINNGKRLG